MREIITGGLIFRRRQEETPNMLGLWERAPAELSPQWRVFQEVDRETAIVLDRLTHLEDTLVDKERSGKKTDDVSITLTPDDLILMKADVPVAFERGDMFVSIYWDGDEEEEEL